MSNHACATPSCGRPSPDGTICTSCTDAVRRDLAKLAGSPVRPAAGARYDEQGRREPEPDCGLLADLEVTLTRQDVADPDTARPAELPGPDDIPHPLDEPIAANPLPPHLGAGNVLADAHGDLRRWTAALVNQRYGRELDGIARDYKLRQTGALGPWRDTITLPDGRSPRELALWLGRHLHDLRQHPHAADIVTGTARHVARAENICTGRDVEYLGRCTECWEGHGHEEHLYADRHADMVTCPRCASAYDTAAMRAYLLGKVADERVRAGTLASALVDYVRTVRAERGVLEYPTAQGRPMTAKAIRGHGDRGRIMRYVPTQAEIDAGAEPEPKFRVGEVMELVVAMAEEDRDRMARRGVRAA